MNSSQPLFDLHKRRSLAAQAVDSISKTIDEAFGGNTYLASAGTVKHL
jgi:hypothetical protein